MLLHFPAPGNLQLVTRVTPYLCAMLKETLINATEAGAKVMQHYFNSKNLLISNKEGINNLVTEVDHASEDAIIKVIKNNFPQHHILSEECGDLVQDSEYKWIIDPIDGTVNFAHRIPICCISIGIEHNKKNDACCYLQSFYQ